MEIVLGLWCFIVFIFGGFLSRISFVVSWSFVLFFVYIELIYTLGGKLEGVLWLCSAGRTGSQGFRTYSSSLLFCWR